MDVRAIELGTLALPIVPLDWLSESPAVICLIAGNRAAHGRDDEVPNSGDANDNPSDIQPNLVHSVLLKAKMDYQFMFLPVASDS